MTEETAQLRAGPALPKRLLYTVFSPGRMTAAVAGHPSWVGALLVSAVLIGLAAALIPADILLEAQRRAALQGGAVQLRVAMGEGILRIVAPIAALLGAIVMSFLVAGVYSILFGFVLGDSGSYRQYLAMVAHASFVPAIAGLLYTPLRIVTVDPQFQLSIASFLVFMPDGYWLNFFRVMDLTQIWSMLIVAEGASAIDRRRTFASAAMILLGLLVALALIVARFIPN